MKIYKMRKGKVIRAIEKYSKKTHNKLITKLKESYHYN